jgi:hypothetical protein
MQVFYLFPLNTTVYIYNTLIDKGKLIFCTAVATPGIVGEITDLQAESIFILVWGLTGRNRYNGTTIPKQLL